MERKEYHLNLKLEMDKHKLHREAYEALINYDRIKYRSMLYFVIDSILKNTSENTNFNREEFKNFGSSNIEKEIIKSEKLIRQDIQYSKEILLTQMQVLAIMLSNFNQQDKAERIQESVQENLKLEINESMINEKEEIDEVNDEEEFDGEGIDLLTSLYSDED